MTSTLRDGSPGNASIGRSELSNAVARGSGMTESGSHVGTAETTTSEARA